jgi:hypothetical protein
VEDKGKRGSDGGEREPQNYSGLPPHEPGSHPSYPAQAPMRGGGFGVFRVGYAGRGATHRGLGCSLHGLHGGTPEANLETHGQESTPETYAQEAGDPPVDFRGRGGPLARVRIGFAGRGRFLNRGGLGGDEL